VVEWEQGRRSENVEDRRRSGGKKMALGGGGISIVMLIIVFIMTKGDLGKVMQVAQQQAQQAPVQQADPNAPVDPREERLKEYVTVILADTEDVWTELFKKMGRNYEKPVLVFFKGEVSSACGNATSASGPFYCPGDNKLYIDLAFYEELDKRFGAPGDFAQAYVVAHEVGHHVQNQLGILPKINGLQRQVNEVESNRLQVAVELQADYLAGVWAHHSQQEKKNIRLERGDVEEGLNAARMIGDDTLQKKAQGYVVKESFTHGSAAERSKWFKKGMQTGDVSTMMAPFDGLNI